MKRIITSVVFGLLLFFNFTATGQEIDLTSISQLEDESNIGKTFRMTRHIDLKGDTLNILKGITLMPGGGMFFNGFIGNVDFDIIDKKNRVFDYSIVFLNRYTKPFLVEWFGARGDGGITDDAPAIEKSIMYATDVQLRNHRTYYLKNPVNVDRSGNISINGNGGRIIGDGFELEPMINFGSEFSQVTVENLKIDGELKNAQGIGVNSSFKGFNLHIQNLETPLGKSFGIRAIIKKTSNVFIENSYINNIRAPKSGSPANDQGEGISRAIIVEWFGEYPDSNVTISNNTLQNVVGIDGDVIQIAQVQRDFDTKNKTIIRDNAISFGTRRLIKASSSNVEIYNNTFETFATGHPDSELDPGNKTYMVAFQRFFGTNADGDPNDGKDQDFVLGSRFENNTFISDANTDHGNGGSLGFQQTKGAIIKNNKFFNSQIVFRAFNQQARISNNDFTNSGIVFARNAHVFNDFRIFDNFSGIIDSRKISRFVKAAIHFVQSCYVEELIVNNNDFTVYDSFGKETTFLNMDSGSTIERLILTNNKLIKKEANIDSDILSNPIFLRSGNNFQEPTIISNNRIVSTKNRLDVGLRFIGTYASFPFSYSNNILDLPDSTDEFDPILIPNGGIP